MDFRLYYSFWGSHRLTRTNREEHTFFLVLYGLTNERTNSEVCRDDRKLRLSMCGLHAQTPPPLAVQAMQALLAVLAVPVPAVLALLQFSRE